MPPPPSRLGRAALTMASTASRVMSPRHRLTYRPAERVSVRTRCWKRGGRHHLVVDGLGWGEGPARPECCVVGFVQLARRGAGCLKQLNLRGQRADWGGVVPCTACCWWWPGMRGHNFRPGSQLGQEHHRRAQLVLPVFFHCAKISQNHIFFLELDETRFGCLVTF
jgi:hypothetical protein